MLTLLFRLLSYLSLIWLHRIGSALGWLVYWLAPSYRRRLQENLHRSGYSALRNAAVAEAGKSLMELPFVWCAPQQHVLQKAQVQDWAVAQAAFDRGRGVIFLTPHLGCFEITAQVIAERVPLTVLYREPRQRMLRPLMENARSRPNLLLAPADLRGVRRLLKALKNGGAIGLLPDQVPQNGEGVWADFFNTPAYTMTLPAKLQSMTGAIVILAYAQRLPDGAGFAVRFAPGPALEESSPPQQARLLNLSMEGLIAHCPAQYTWSYNRFKTPARARKETI